MIIGVISGMEQFSASTHFIGGGTVRVAQHYRRYPRSKVDVPLPGAKRSENNEVAEIGTSMQINAAERNKHHGVWVTSRFVVPHGSCITLQISKKNGGAIIYDNGFFVLLMREEAALRRLSIPFTGNPNATLSSGIIEGRFDIVQPDQFDNIGYTINNSFVEKYFFSEEADFFEEIIVEEEIKKMPVISAVTIETEKGPIRVNRSPTRRNIRISKP